MSSRPPDGALCPDRWVLLRVSITTPDYDEYTCVLAGWDHMQTDEWRRSTAIVARQFDSVHARWIFDTESGSRYYCDPQQYGLTPLTSSVLAQMQQRAAQCEATVDVQELDAL